MFKLLAGIFVSAFVCFFCADCKAQSYFTVASASYSQASTEVVSAHPVYQSLQANLSIPIQLKQDNKLMTGLNYSQSDIVFDSITFHQNFYSIGVPLGYLHNTKKGNILMMGFFRLNSDFILLNHKSYQAGGVVLASRTLRDGLVIKYGLYYNSDLFGPFFAPLLGIDWKALPKWRVFGVMPSTLTIENKQNDFFRWGLAYQSPNTTFQVNAPRSDLYLHQGQTRLGLFSDFYLSKKIAATLKLDYPIVARYRVFDASQRYAVNVWGLGFGGERSKKTRPIEKLHHSIIFQIGLSYRVELE